MKDELDSMKSNEVWDLVKLPKRAKAIGYKWVYKIKGTTYATLKDIKRDCC